MIFDYSNLKGEIKKQYNSIAELSSATGISKSALNEHLRKGTAFTIEQVMSIMRALSLSITSQQIVDLFFVVKS